jgi:hypothetical protein
MTCNNHFNLSNYTYIYAQKLFNLGMTRCSLRPVRGYASGRNFCELPLLN